MGITMMSSQKKVNNKWRHLRRRLLACLLRRTLNMQYQRERDRAREIELKMMTLLEEITFR